MREADVRRLLAFMEKHKFETLADFQGQSLDYFTTHAELVRLKASAKPRRKPPREIVHCLPTATGMATSSSNNPPPLAVSDARFSPRQRLVQLQSSLSQAPVEGGWHNRLDNHAASSLSINC